MLADGQSAEAALRHFTSCLWDSLVNSTNKDFSAVSVEFLVESSWAAPISGTSMPLGAWLSRAICLVPIQICRVGGGKLLPLCDGQHMSADPAAAGSMEAIA